MPLISSLPPNGTVSGPLPNVLPQAVAQAAGAAGASPTAQSLLPSAVVASANVPNYSEARANKPIPKLVSNQSSSALAAQYLGQTPQATDEELAIFQPREAFTNALASATENFATVQAAPQPAPAPAANAPASSAPAAATVTVPTLSLISNFANATPATSFAYAATQALALKAEPSATQPPALGKKPGIARSSGANAYQLTNTRNDTRTVQPSAEAIF